MRDDVRRTPKDTEEEKADASFQAFQRFFAGVWHTLVIFVFVISCSKLTGTVLADPSDVEELCLKASTEHCCFEPQRRAGTQLLTCSIQTNSISIAMCVFWGRACVDVCVQYRVIGLAAGATHCMFFARNRVHYDSSVFKENHFSSECGHFPASCFQPHQFVANRCFYYSLPTSFAKSLQSTHRVNTARQEA